MFGLAALAALMAMAFVGASSAMAGSTTLCTADGSGCGVSHVHETTLSGTKAKLLTSFLTVECDALFLGSTSGGTLASPLVIVGNFTYTNCGGCSATEVSSSSTIKVLKVAGTEKSKVTGEGEVFVDCGSSFECTYDGEGLEGTGKGPLSASETNGEVSLSEQTTHKVPGSDFFCPKEGKLDITTTPLSATYISS
jgi:hypothetical protein